MCEARDKQERHDVKFGVSSSRFEVPETSNLRLSRSARPSRADFDILLESLRDDLPPETPHILTA